MKRTYAGRPIPRGIRGSYRIYHSPYLQENYKLFTKMDDFSAGILINNEKLSESKKKSSKIKQYVTMFPDMYEDLEFNEIDMDTLELNLADRKNSELNPFEYVYRQLKISFCFKGNKLIKNPCGLGTTDPFVYREETREYMLSDIVRN